MPAVKPSYPDVIEALYALRRSGMRLHRGRVEKALRLRGNPERSVPVVHIAGTNGKGSTAATLASIARASGLRTGLFTSPHLHRFVERIQVNGRPLGEAGAARRLTSLWRTQANDVEFPALSFFETLTLLAFEVFRDRGCELAVLETGLGGRLDATNVVSRPLATILTPIGLDHCAILGSTIGKIAREKAGILKAGVPLLTSVRDRTARRVIQRIADQKQVPARWIDEDFGWLSDDTGRGRSSVTVSVGAERFEGLRPALAGEHQCDNLATAVAAASELRRQGLPITEKGIRGGVQRVRWPGRMEWIGSKPRFLLEAAHNPQGCRALVRHLASLPPLRRVLVFSSMKDKAYPEMLRLLAPAVQSVVIVSLPMVRAASLAQLAHAGREAGSRVRKARSVTEAISIAKKASGDSGEVLVAGSLFLISSIRARLLDLPEEPLVGL